MSEVVEKDSRHKLIVLVTFINFGLFASRAGIGGDLINEVFDGDRMPPPHPVSQQLVITTLIQCCIGMAAVGSSVLHCKAWNEISRAVAAGVGMITLMLNFLVAGYGCKQIDLDPDQVNEREEALAVLAIVQLIFMIVYFGMVNSFTHGVVMLGSPGAAKAPGAYDPPAVSTI